MTFTLATQEKVAVSVCESVVYGAYDFLGDQLGDGIPGVVVHHWPV